MNLSKAYCHLLVPFFLLCNGLGPACAGLGDTSTRVDLQGGNQVTVTILYDNYPFDPRLKTGWGFSCLIRGLERNILFDTGGDGSVLLHNMRQLGVGPAGIDLIVLSHIHGDHTGGLRHVLAGRSDVVVYLPASFPEDFKQAVRSFGARVVGVSKAQEIMAGVYTTGDLGDGIREQALALKTSEGLVVVTGCAHPGILTMVRRAREISREDRVYLVMGGFHLGGEPPSRIESIAGGLRLLSVEKVAPCHCSGEETRRLFRERFAGDYIESGVGKRIKLPSLHCDSEYHRGASEEIH